MTSPALPSPPGEKSRLSTGAWDELVALVKLGAPLAAAQVGLVTMSLVDTAILGHISREEFAGAALGRNISYATNAFGMGAILALEPMASQALGAGEPGRAWQAFLATLRASFLFFVPTILVTFAITFAFPYFGIDEAVGSRARSFLLGYTPAVLFFFLFLAEKTFLEAHSSTMPAMLASVVANVWNAIACTALVRGDEGLEALGLYKLGVPRLGLSGHGALGAGLATSSAMALLAALLLGPVLRARPKARSLRVETTALVRLGLPIGAQLLAEIGVFALASLFAGRLGAAVLSAHQVAIGLASFTFMGAMGVSGATAVRVGYAVGAGVSPRRVGLVGFALGAGVMAIPALTFALFAVPVARLFTTDVEVQTLAAELMTIAAFFQIFDGVQVVGAGSLRGAGDVRFSFLANLFGHWAVGLPVALLLGFRMGMGARGIWWGLTAGLVAVAVSLLARFLVVSKRAIARVDA